MRTVIFTSGAAALIAAVFAVNSYHNTGKAMTLTPADTLEDAAARSADVPSRVPLETPPPDTPRSALAPAGSVAPSYARTLGTMPHLAAPLVRLVDTFLLEGALPATLKAGVGLRVAQITGSGYLATHALRLLRATPDGQWLLAAMEDESAERAPIRETLAVGYAESLTRDVNGVRDEAFRNVRAHFNDSEIVELTMTTAFFNFMARYAEALRLPIEPWAGDAVMLPPPRSPDGSARVALLSDEVIAAAAAATAAAQTPEAQRTGLGLGLANSQRAMLRVPALAAAWRAVTAAARDGETVGRDIKLQVSFAVSMANGCRYCTIHQVVGLRRLGVEPAKLVAMKKDDSALTPRELVAVRFARILTSAPASVTDDDFAALVGEFGERGALEIVFQTCTFAFMNRVTDGLRLPSEDEAVRIYQETYNDTTE